MACVDLGGCPYGPRARASPAAGWLAPRSPYAVRSERRMARQDVLPSPRHAQEGWPAISSCALCSSSRLRRGRARVFDDIVGPWWLVLEPDAARRDGVRALCLSPAVSA